MQIDGAGPGNAREPDGSVPRRCGACSLCCTVLRVDELEKLGGTHCVHQRTGSEGGCKIHARRPGICRAYRCLWLRGGLRPEDRPDRLGAVLDLLPRGTALRLEIREAEPGATERSARLAEIAADFRRTVPVRITDVAHVMDPDRPFRVLLPDGEEHLVEGERITVRRGEEVVAQRRLPWAERLARRISLGVLSRRLRRSAAPREGR